MKAALYARFSSDLQRATSIEDQFRNCRKRAAAESWAIVDTFADEAMSGSDTSRPQYRAMLAAASRDVFQILLVDDLSRLTRDAVESERVIRRLEFSGIRIVSVSDGYDSTSKARKVHRGFKGLMNEIFLDDLRERVHRGLAGQVIKGYWTGGRPYGYRLKPVLHPTERDQYGEPAKIATKLEIEPEQAAIVLEMFERFADGASCRTIAQELNDRGVPSPGSTWKRKVRRCAGWMGSAVRVILKNPLYTGMVRWNVSQFVRDPDSEKYKRRKRPKAEWHTYQDETLRIISDELFAKADHRTRLCTNNDKRLKSGGKVRYLLSGLLTCNVCGAHYILADARSYSCSGHSQGGACSNGIRVRRTAVESIILDPIRKELLEPQRVTRMAREIEAGYAERMKAAAKRAVTAPDEAAALDSRIARLRERLRTGDPDMTADELQATIERAEAKRRELDTAPSLTRHTAQILAALPRAAELYKQQISLGLSGDREAITKARPLLRELLGGEIRLSPGENGTLWAEYGIHMAALLQGAGTSGRGDRI
jgi:site-specific DNA recombinase